MQSLMNDEEKPTSISLNEPIKALVVDDDENPKKEKSLIFGTASGKLIHHKQVWFTNKNVTLFAGNDSPVTSISWRKDIVAWADLTLVRLMNITTQTAICFVNPPSGVGTQNPFPCQFFWETDTDLFLAWADSARHVEVLAPASSISSSSQNPKPSSSKEENEASARVVMEYQLDCIACGISAFDADHLILFGYVPPDEATISAEENLPKHALSASNRPEVKIMKRSNGQFIACDTLPMQGQVFQGPWDYHFLSSYMCPSRGKYSKKWQISSNTASSSTNPTAGLEANKSGKYNISPVLILCSPSDLVIAKVRDVNDRIGIALQNGDLLLAANLAMSDRLSLRHYQYHDILALYIDDLLEQEQPTDLQQELNEERISFIAAECARLIGVDVMLWERWINTFIARKLISYLLPYIPTSNPKLSSTVYELLLEHFFKHESTTFLSLIELWGRIKPALFNHEVLIRRLESSPSLDPWSMEGLAQLYLWSKKYEKALNTYLDINYALVSESQDNASGVSRSRRTVTEESVQVHASEKTTAMTMASPQAHRSEERANFIHVFELIEKESLYEVVQHKILNLFRLSRELSVSMLTKHVDRFPVAAVVRQLRVDKRLLKYYLHYLFTKYEAYNNDRQYSEYHIMQVALYAEFAPKFEKPQIDIESLSPWGQQQSNQAYSSGTSSSSSQTSPRLADNFAELIGLKGKNHYEDSEFMSFLRASKFYPLDYALRECEKRKPPLYYEMVYILDLKGSRRDALVS
jgi:vacuolar protein sorting-associated protein 41